MTGTKGRVDGIAPWQFDEYVLAEADGIATPEQLAVLEADPAAVAPVARCEAARGRGAPRERAVAARRRARTRSSPTWSSSSVSSRPPSPGTCRSAPPHPTRPAAATAARRSHAPTSRTRRSSPASRSCRCRGSRGASSPGGRCAGPVGSAGGGTDARGGRRAPSRAGCRTCRFVLSGGVNADACHPRGRRARVARGRRRRSGRRRDRLERPLARPGRDLGGRAHRGARWSRSCAAARAAARAPRTRAGRTRSAGLRRS